MCRTVPTYSYITINQWWYISLNLITSLPYISLHFTLLHYIIFPYLKCEVCYGECLRSCTHTSGRVRRHSKSFWKTPESIQWIAYILVSAMLTPSSDACSKETSAWLNVNKVISHEDPQVMQRCSSILSLTSALDGVVGQRHAPAAFSAVKTWYPIYRRLGGSQGRSGRMRKISSPPAFGPLTVQPVANRYNDCVKWEYEY
jgi:hypothetical protein